MGNLRTSLSSSSSSLLREKPTLNRRVGELSHIYEPLNNVQVSSMKISYKVNWNSRTLTELRRHSVFVVRAQAYRIPP